LDSEHSSATPLRYRPGIDGLRAVAILSVLGFHVSSDLLPGGFCGVDICFSLSGFLITGIVLNELQSGRFSIRQFYARRARRLFPALIIVLLTTFGRGWLILLPDEFQNPGIDVAAGAAFSSNLILYIDFAPYFSSGNRPLVHLWSLGVEEQFYLLWPTLIYAAWRLGKRWIGLIASASSPLPSWQTFLLCHLTHRPRFICHGIGSGSSLWVRH
jgi:peptidoglycan/LPS O-acetylase OafA/YrhL